MMPGKSADSDFTTSTACSMRLWGTTRDSTASRGVEERGCLGGGNSGVPLWTTLRCAAGKPRLINARRLGSETVTIGVRW